jgi:hypothetical protein
VGAVGAEEDARRVVGHSTLAQICRLPIEDARLRHGRKCAYIKNRVMVFPQLRRRRRDEMAMLKFLDPRATVNPKEQALAPGLDTLEGKIIGIIDNGQANSTDMFKELASLLRERFHTREILFKTKPTHMQGAPKPIMEELLSRCDAVITGLGA